MSSITTHTTRAEGTILTAAIYNSDHVNHVTNSQNLNTDKMEGATPPVVDGNAVVWDGTSGAALKTAGFAPANVARAINTLTNSGLTGGGTLAADRNLGADFSDQATAEAASSLVKVMSPGRVRNLLDHANAKASQAEAEAAADATKWMSALRVRQLLDHANAKASQAEAEAGTVDTKWSSPLRVAQAITTLAVGLNLTANSSSWNPSGADTGVSGAKGAVFYLTLSNSGTYSVSANGGTNYTTIFTNGGGTSASALIFVKGDRFIIFILTADGVAVGWSTANGALTSGAGNIFFKISSGSGGTHARIM